MHMIGVTSMATTKLQASVVATTTGDVGADTQAEEDGGARR